MDIIYMIPGYHLHGTWMIPGHPTLAKLTRFIEVFHAVAIHVNDQYHFLYAFAQLKSGGYMGCEVLCGVMGCGRF